MFYAVRCPSCLLTIYTVLVANREKRLIVIPLDGDSLRFYNCPFALCDYHFDINHDVNLYAPTPDDHRTYSPGFTIARRTPLTRPFRSKEKVAALAITVDTITLGTTNQGTNTQGTTTQDVPPKPAVMGAQDSEKTQVGHTAQFRDMAQVGDKAQAGHKIQAGYTAPAAKDVCMKDEQVEDAAVPATAHNSTPQKNKSRGQRWTAAEMDKVTRLVNEGRGHEEIAKDMERSASGVKNKIAAMREKGEISIPTTPLKRKRDPNEVNDRPSSIPYRGGPMDRTG